MTHMAFALRMRRPDVDQLLDEISEEQMTEWLAFLDIQFGDEEEDQSAESQIARCRMIAMQYNLPVENA